MAERRMFAKTIIDSDAFLDMPLSTQSLYFHLSMRADDEGFINNPKKIQRMIGASDDDLKLLIAKSFIINFESGIIVIKHWKIHNYIRGDRLQKTQYQEERQLLEVKDNGAYTLGSGFKEISATEKRQIAYKESELPYCFTYKIRRAFDGKQCPICGGTMHSSARTTMPTIQHNIPISKGGKHVIKNISVICESCNTSIKDKETGALNNADVVRTWDAILIAEEQKIDWFYNTELLDTIDVRHMSDTCPSNVSIGKVRIDKDSIDYKRKDESKDSSKRKNFIPPTIDEVRAYCAERKNYVDAEMFINFYESKGWMVGKNKMKDWKAAVRTWERSSNRGTKTQNVSKPTVLRMQLDGVDFCPPNYGLPKDWFDGDKLIEERMTPILQPALPDMGMEEYEYSVKELKEKYKLRRQAYENFRKGS